MALLEIDGFDTYDPQDPGGRLVSVNALVTTDTGRDGVGKCLSFPPSNQTSVGHPVTKTLPTMNTDTFVIGFSFYMSVDLVGTQNVLHFYGPSGYTEFRVVMSSSGQLDFWSGTALVATSDDSITSGMWHTIEMKVHMSNAGSVVCRLNGAVMPGVEGTETKDMLYVDSSVSKVIIYGGNYYSGTFKYDDFYFLDTSGTENNDFLGQVRVVTRFADADATPNDFTATGAGTTKADRVSEVVPDDDTTYLSSDTVGDEENFSFAALPSTVDTVLAVQAVSLSRKDGAGDRLVKHNIRSGAATGTGTAHGLADGYTYTLDIFEQDPNTSAAWTKSAADALELGLEISS